MSYLIRKKKEEEEERPLDSFFIRLGQRREEENSFIFFTLPFLSIQKGFFFVSVLALSRHIKKEQDCNSVDQ